MGGHLLLLQLCISLHKCLFSNCNISYACSCRLIPVSTVAYFQTITFPKGASCRIMSLFTGANFITETFPIGASCRIMSVSAGASCRIMSVSTGAIIEL